MSKLPSLSELVGGRVLVERTNAFFVHVCKGIVQMLSDTIEDAAVRQQAEINRHAHPPMEAMVLEHIQGSPGWVKLMVVGSESPMWYREDFVRVLQVLPEQLPLTRAVNVYNALTVLRAQEGDEVTINCQNPEGVGPDNEAVDVCGGWTGFEVLRFYGRSLEEALTKAVTARNAKNAKS